MRVEVRAIDLAKHYFTEQGYTVEDVSRKRGHNGYDFLISRENAQSKVEVKGYSRKWQIPDLFSTKFDQNKRLIADILCVVYLIKSQKPSICVIPRNAIPPSDVTPKISYRISSRFEKNSVLEKYWRPLVVEDKSDGKLDTSKATRKRRTP